MVLIPIQEQSPEVAGTSQMTVPRVAVPRSRAVRRVEEATGNPLLWVARFSIQGEGSRYWI